MKYKNNMLSSIRTQLAKFETNTRLFEFLNRSVVVLMGIFIFLNPFPHTTSIKEACYYLALFIVLVLVLLRKTEFSFKTPLLLPFGLFAFWSFLSIFFALDKQNSIHDFRSHLLEYIILYYILINYFGSRKRLIALSWIIIISSTIFSAAGSFYYYFLLGNKLSTRIGLYGLFTEIPTDLIGLVTVFAIILSLHHLVIESRLYRKAILTICLCSLFLTTLLTQARAVLVGLFLAIILLLFKKKAALVALLAAMLIVVAISPVKSRFFFSEIASDKRVGTNYLAFEVMKDYPIIGIGFGMEAYGTAIDLHEYNEKVPKKYRERIHPDPHNILSSVVLRVGFVGIVFFFYIIFTFARMSWKLIKHGKDDFIKGWGRCMASAFSAFFFIGMFQPVFSHVPEVVLFTIFSMITILWRLNNDTESA